MQQETHPSILETCPIRNVIARLGNKWSLLVIHILAEHGVMRYGQLGREIPDISSRVLSGTLRTLEADGLVARKVYPVVPPRVEYRLTETGRSLVPLIDSLTAWAQNHMQTILSHRREFERRSK
ncbi:winged helix-turn-helix transcriptional regulator [Alistipes sp.]|uniref:winged helix-turn-helix transcriptional regulator n=1 Tax=Alistipes sp. TaxID=1872444 RepID=UPI003AF15E56